MVQMLLRQGVQKRMGAGVVLKSEKKSGELNTALGE